MIHRISPGKLNQKLKTLIFSGVLVLVDHSHLTQLLFEGTWEQSSPKMEGCINLIT